MFVSGIILRQAVSLGRAFVVCSAAMYAGGVGSFLAHENARCCFALPLRYFTTH